LASDPRCVIADPLRGCIIHNHACRLVEMGLAAQPHKQRTCSLPGTSPQCHFVSTGTQMKPISAVSIYFSRKTVRLYRSNHQVLRRGRISPEVVSKRQLDGPWPRGCGAGWEIRKPNARVAAVSASVPFQAHLECSWVQGLCIPRDERALRHQELLEMDTREVHPTLSDYLTRSHCSVDIGTQMKPLIAGIVSSVQGEHLTGIDVATR
jgi:hypothetical protein